MATSSSTKKAAKLAQRSGRTSVRFQGGTLFPMLVAIILVVGLGLIIYARQSRPVQAQPTTNDHWHASYGFYLCDPKTGEMGWKQLSGTLEGSPDYIGVHSHDDSVIHWHPQTSAATGENAQLEVFLESYGVELSDTELTIPAASLGLGEGAEDLVYNEDDTKCGDEDGLLTTQVWNSFTDTEPAGTHTSGMGDIRLDQDFMVFTIAFAPSGTDIPMPPNASELPTLGAADDRTTGQTQPLGGTVPAGSTPAGGTTPVGTAPAGGTQPATGSPAPATPRSTVPASAPPTTATR